MNWDNVTLAFSTWEWGTFPEYLGAIGTIGAVGAALWIARRDGKRFEDEQEAATNDRKEAARERAEAARDRELYRQEVETERDERQRRVAGRVTLAFGSRSTVSAGLNRSSKFSIKDLYLTVKNASDYPIFHPSQPLKVDSKEHPRVIGRWFTLNPGESVTHDIPEWAYSRMFFINLHFFDGTKPWRRELLGALKPVSPEEMGYALGFRRTNDGKGWHQPSETEPDMESEGGTK